MTSFWQTIDSEIIWKLEKKGRKNYKRESERDLE